MNWGGVLDDYAWHLKLERACSEHTIKAYVSDIIKLKAFAESLTPAATPINITLDQIQEFVYQSHDMNLSARSRARMLSAIKSFFDYVLNQELRVDHPSELIDAPKIGMHLPDVLALEEINAIIAAIDESTIEGQRNKVMLEMLYGTGARVSELVHMQLSDLFLQESMMRIIGKGNKQRLVPLADYTMGYLETYLKNIRPEFPIKPTAMDTLFLNRRGAPLSRVMVFTIIKNATAKAGIQKSVSPHTFRHSYATHMYQNGANLRGIQLLLGHENIVTTEIYTHINNQYLRETLNAYHPRSQLHENI